MLVGLCSAFISWFSPEKKSNFHEDQMDIKAREDERLHIHEKIANDLKPSNHERQANGFRCRIG